MQAGIARSPLAAAMVKVTLLPAAYETIVLRIASQEDLHMAAGMKMGGAFA
jgi:hypothetical protein